MMSMWPKTKQHVQLTLEVRVRSAAASLPGKGLSLPPQGPNHQALPSGTARARAPESTPSQDYRPATSPMPRTPSPSSQPITPQTFTSTRGFYASIMCSHFMWGYVLCVPKSS